MADEEKNEELFDVLLKMVVSDALKKDMDALPSNVELNEKYKGSQELNRQIEKLIFQGKIKSRMRYYVKNVGKIAACFIIILFLSTIALVSVEATRNHIFNALVDKFGDYTQIQFHDSKKENKEINRYQPTYLPDGFKEKTIQTFGNTVLQIYSNESNDEIVFKQRPAEKGTALLDNENTKYEEVEISGNSAYLFKALKKEDYSILLWQAEGTAFELTSQISSDELVRIGNSVEK